MPSASNADKLLAMIRTLYVVHHSHTDIGYTHAQARIVRWHGDYIRQAMEIAARRDDFRWQCETFFPVEAFWKDASEADPGRFIAALRAGTLAVSGSFFNYTELLDADLHRTMALRVRSFADEHQVPLRAAMTADINGTTLAHAQALADAGIELLVTFIHPHHGFVPLAKRAGMYTWDLGDGRTIDVVHSDHYHMGNELGLVPFAATNYAWLWDGAPTYPYHDGLLETRLPMYLKRIEADGWDADWFVVAASGLGTDNAPPSEHLPERIARWNTTHTDIRIQMITLTELAGIAKRTAKPTHRGDCPDWWADGVAGDPEAVLLFREAQRKRRFLVDLAKYEPRAVVDLTALDDALSLYAEHTSGHAVSVRHPANLHANQLRARKIGYAADAADLAEMLIDRSAQAIGAGPTTADRELKYRVVNVSDHAMHELVSPPFEWTDPNRWGLRADTARITRLDNDQPLPMQVINSYRGSEIVVDVDLKPGESIDFKIESPAPAPFGLNPHAPVPDRANDLVGMSDSVSRNSIRTKHVEIDISAPAGITAWRDANGTSLIDTRYHVAPFSIVASRLTAPMDGDRQCDVRRRLGRNRNGQDAVWSTSTLKRIRGSGDGPLAQMVDLEYELPGCEFVWVRLLAYHDRPRVDVEVAMHKVGTWDAENLYLALPFRAGDDQKLFLDRGARPMRPGVDQIPGTLIDFYGVQDGIAWTDSQRGVAVAQRDSHLVQVGPLAYGIRELADGRPVGERSCVYAWLMTNYWETNFAPELGGFYAFRYSVMWGESLRDANAALRACRGANAGLNAFRLAGK